MEDVVLCRPSRVDNALIHLHQTVFLWVVEKRWWMHCSIGPVGRVVKGARFKDLPAGSLPQQDSGLVQAHDY
eukprot:2899158-Pyramimonas_sp.AAC.1